MTIRNVTKEYWPLMLTGAFGIAVFCFWLLYRPHLMLAREEMQLFLWNTDYLSERLLIPGGLAQYLGEFVVQFFLNPLSGALCYALILTAVQLLGWYIIDARRRYCILSFIVPCLLWWMACNPDIPMTPVIAVVLTMALMALLKRRTAVTQAVLLLAVPVGYWLLGPAVVLLALVPFVCWHAKPLKASVAMSVGIALLTALCVLVSSRLSPYPLRQLARGVDYYWESQMHSTLEEMRYDMLMRTQDWEEISALYDARPSQSLAVRNAVLVAKLNRHEISQVDVLQGLVLSKEALRSIASAFLMSELSMQIGMVNIAQRTAFEAMEAIPNYNKSARALRRLVETNIVTGQYEVALKYIALLEQTLFYRDWARRMKRMADNPDEIKNHKIYQQMKELYDNGTDTFFH